MAGWLNLCQFIGNAGKDPEARYQPDGSAIVRVSIAVNESWKDKNGEKKERVTWIPVVCFGKTAEIALEYVKKGAQLYVQGRFSVRQYEKDGETKYTTEVIGDRILMLGNKQQNEPSEEKPKPGKTGDRFHGMEDDIPF
jgi:single-strand DNA-binding protein